MGDGLDGVVMIANTNMSSLPPSSRKWWREMVDNLWDPVSNIGVLRNAYVVLFSWDSSSVLFIQSIFRLCSSNQGRPRTNGCSGLRIMLKEIMLAKSPRATRIGSNSSTISRDAIRCHRWLLQILGSGGYSRGCFVSMQTHDPWNKSWLQNLRG